MKKDIFLGALINATFININMLMVFQCVCRYDYSSAVSRSILFLILINLVFGVYCSYLLLRKKS